MEYNEESSMQFIDGKMVDIDKLSADEADALIVKVEEEMERVENELKSLIYGDEEEAE